MLLINVYGVISFFDVAETNREQSTDISTRSIRTSAWRINNH